MKDPEWPKRNVLLWVMSTRGLSLSDITLLTDTNTVPLLSPLITNPKGSKKAAGALGMCTVLLKDDLFLCPRERRSNCDPLPPRQGVL